MQQKLQANGIIMPVVSVAFIDHFIMLSLRNITLGAQS